MAWIDLIDASAVAQGKATRVDRNGLRLAVVNVGGTFRVIDDECTHEDFSLSEGDVWEDFCEIECPKHASTFSLVTGEPTCLPATRPVRVYEARVECGQVQADLPAAAEDGS